MDAHRAPIIQYGVENKTIPGNPKGWKLKDCGNIAHWNDSERYENGDTVRDTAEELVVDLVVEGLSVRYIKLHDACYNDKDSYRKAKRAKKVAGLSDAKMYALESPMGRDMENFLMAQRIHCGRAPEVPMHRPTPTNPLGSENRKSWYKMMRGDACRAFWVKTTRYQRDAMRTEALNPPEELLSLWTRIRSYFCKFTGLFHFLYGEYEVNKVEEAVCKWASLPPLPLPETSRHMVDDFIRDTKHLEMDLENATTLKEIEQRQQCVVHYGTWAMKGRHNPDRVWSTVDTLFERGASRKILENLPRVLMPTFTQYVLGLGSEVVRFLFSTLVPDEYQTCCDVFNALPDLQKMNRSEPTFATLVALGINSYTQRHTDQTDVDFGGNLCFPQLGMQVPYQRGDSVVFRGSEIEHFVADWTGYRIFLLYTNHQPVRSYAYRTIGRLPPKPKDPWNPERGQRSVQSSEANSALYSPCWMEPAEQEPEELYEADIHGAAYMGRWDPSEGSGSSSGTDFDRGRLVVALPPTEETLQA
ncbi:hypothetical protein DL764_003767 [Monosporascus ibericus]|uniref:Uncharacterized protein n=1 Tax=Monosporascus ibericus TaxID=155417 RepID=A0A4Q4TIP8_9PEZI|nr:hypothetical protein DL764_003767 [Monosporascus ibericus]